MKECCLINCQEEKKKDNKLFEELHQALKDLIELRDLAKSPKSSAFDIAALAKPKWEKAKKILEKIERSE